MKEEFDYSRGPDDIGAGNSVFFKQDSIDRAAVVYEEHMGPGMFTAHQEDESVQEASIRSANLTTKSVNNYKRDIPIPDEFFSDEQHDVVNYQARELGRTAKASQDKFALEQSYGDAFTAASGTPDGAALASNSHVALNGDTIDNLETGALTADNLEVVVRSLRKQKAQDGSVGSHNAQGLLVSLNLHPDAVEITQSELKAGIADNELNYWSHVYPGMIVGTSPWLHSDHNTLNADVNTSYFAISRNHRITRWVREAFNTKLVPPDTDKRDRWFYKGRFREIVAPMSWGGVVGSNGTA